MTATRPYPWEKSYPPGIRWDAPLETATLTAIFEGAVARYGERPAIDYREQTISYRALGEFVDRAATGLRRLGIGRGSSVALYLPNTPYHPILFFAALRTGARLVHLSPLDAERELSFKLKDSGARTLVTVNVPGMMQVAQKLAAGDLVDHLIVGDEAFWGTPPFPPLPIPEEGKTISVAKLMEGPAETGGWPALALDDVAALQYTGGTTGTPKGAMLTHANLSAAVAQYELWASSFGTLRPGEEKVICVLPLFHIYGLTAILLRYLKGGNEILLRMRFDPDATLRDIAEKRATTLMGVPTMWIALASHPEIGKKDLSSLAFCNSGGAPLPVEVANQFERLTRQRIGTGWGMTETSPSGTTVPPPGGPEKPGSIGLPLPGIYMDVVALDDPRRVLPPNEKGEIRIKGPNVMKGYWNRPEDTASSFVEGMFLTGDTGYMDEDGYFFIVDRKKDMILSGGFNVYPRLVEEAIYEHPAVEEAVVIGIPDAYRGQAAKAFLKLKPGHDRLTLEELRGFLADKLGKHEMPAALEIRDSLPRTAVGKLSKKELADEERRKGEKLA